MKAGEIWEIQTNSGYTREVVVVAAHEGYCTCLTLTDNPCGYLVISRKQQYTDCGRLQYIFNDQFTEFVKKMPDNEFAALKDAVAEALGIEQKTVEVPVEKIVEIPSSAASAAHYVDTFEELATAKAEAGIYKDLYEKLLAKVMG